MDVTIVIPTYQRAAWLKACLEAILPQLDGLEGEIIVVADGGSSDAQEVVHELGAPIRYLEQEHAGPAVARNLGAQNAAGDILVFTDDDCLPDHDWLAQMLAPFSDPGIVGAKGRYRTTQSALVARFIQAEYEDKYRKLSKQRWIDFIDTYSAAFRRQVFLTMDGFSAAFPEACAEDVEFSYRLAEEGYRMVFVNAAVVAHRHPETLLQYLKKKYRFAYWRMLALRMHPGKSLRDLHTPQTMKLQLLAPPVILALLFLCFVGWLSWLWFLGGGLLFFLTTLPVVTRLWRKDKMLACLASGLFFFRSSAQLLGVGTGLVRFGLK